MNVRGLVHSLLKTGTLVIGATQKESRKMSRRNQLIKEANRLAEEINKDRAEGMFPSAEATVRLLEVTELLLDIRKKRPVFSEYAIKEGD